MRTAALLLALGLAGCRHTLPPAADLDRAEGPFAAGSPARLTSVAVNLLGWSADDRSLLLLRHDRPVVRVPGEPARRDTLDICLAMMPSSGGSAFWQWCDGRATQRDSVNRIVSAAVDPDGRVIATEVTGPVGWPHFPVSWSATLWVGDTGRPGERRELLQLYRDRFGTPVVPPGTINWLEGLAWLSSGEFVAVASHMTPMPGATPTRLGLVRGRILRDSATLALLDDLTGVTSWSVGPDRAVIVVRGARVERITDPDRAPEMLGEVPSHDGEQVVRARCTPEVCLALSRNGADALPTWRVWRLGVGGSTLLRELRVPYPGVPILPRSANEFLLQHEGVPYRFEGGLEAR